MILKEHTKFSGGQKRHYNNFGQTKMATPAKISIIALALLQNVNALEMKENIPTFLTEGLAGLHPAISRALGEEMSESDDEIVDDMQDFIGQPCVTTDDCGKSRFLVCKEKLAKDSTDLQLLCDHKYLYPMQPIEIVGTIVLTILMALAVMSGIGGGGIIVPLLMVFYKLETKKAIAVSGFTILIGSLSRFGFTYKARHPLKDATCIEYSVTNVMLPIVLIGSVAGVFFNIIFPSVIIQICLTLLLLFLSIQSIFKAKSIYEKENEAFKNK